MSLIVTIIIELTITMAERNHSWGEYSRNEFIDLVEEAMNSGAIKEKDAFNYVMRAMKI